MSGLSPQCTPLSDAACTVVSFEGRFWPVRALFGPQTAKLGRFEHQRSDAPEPVASLGPEPREFRGQTSHRPTWTVVVEVLSFGPLA